MKKGTTSKRGRSIKPATLSQGIQVFGKDIPTPGGISLWTRDKGYLAQHLLRSHWLAEPTNVLDSSSFATLLTSLPALPEEMGTAFHSDPMTSSRTLLPA